MSCVAPVRRNPGDKVGSSVGVNTSSEILIPHPDHKEPLPLLLSLPRLHSSLQTPASPPSDRAYLQAAAIFRQLRTEKPVEQQLLHYGRGADTPPPSPESRAGTAQRRAYQLAFNTLKYQDLLEDMVADSCFHTSQHIAEVAAWLSSLGRAPDGRAFVHLGFLCYDESKQLRNKDRRFLTRDHSVKKDEEPVQEVRDLECSLQRCKTKLAASLARCRVKQNLQSVSCVLSDPVRTKQRRAKCLPLYVWVNTLKTSVEEVCKALQGAGLREVELPTDLREATFCRDPLCPDTLIFPRQLHALLRHRSLTSTHALHTQDRSLCVAVSVLRPLLFDKGDVLVAGSFSALTVAHMCVAAAARSGRVLVCEADHTTAQLEEMQELLAGMDIKNVRVLSKAFCGLGEWDADVQRLKVIIVLPQCSSSALNDPVSAMHSEHGDWDLLPELCHSAVSQSKIHKMASQQARLLAHALTFPKVQTVVYCTRSVYAEENEQLVKRVLEKAHTHPKLLPFRVNGPIFTDGPESRDMTDSKFFRLEASQFTNGCFVARLSRQADPTKVETVHDVLARAAAKGLLGGMIPEHSKTAKKGKSKKSHVASASSKPSSPSSQEGQVGSEVAKDGEEPVAASEHEEERGEGGEEGEEGKEVNKGGKGGKKARGLKGKRKAKGQTSRTKEASKQNQKSRTKKSTKTKVNPAHHKRRLPRSKPRRIPRLTLTLMSSAKPSNHLSPITALAHKLSNSPTVAPQQDDLRAPNRPAPLAPSGASGASKQVQRRSTESGRAARTRKDGGKVVRPRKEDALKPADYVLPPISSPSSGSVSIQSRSSPCARPSRASLSQLAQISASSSSANLPGL